MQREEYEWLAAALDLPIGSCPNVKTLRARIPG